MICIKKGGQCYYIIMMANYERVIQLLQKMQKSEYIKYVQSELQGLSEDPLFINLLSIAIRDNNINHNTKLAAAITLNRTISKDFYAFDEKMVINLLTSILLDLSVDFKYKRAFENTLTGLVQLSDQEMVEEVLDSFYFKLFQHAVIEEESTASEDKEGIIKSQHLLKIQALFFFYKCILDSSNHLVMLSSHLHGNLTNILYKVTINNVPQNLKILQQMDSFFGPFISRLIQSTDASSDDYADLFCGNDVFIQWIYEQLNLQGTPNQCWISFNSHDDHNLLNILKTKAAQVHQNLLSHFGKNILQGLFISKKHYQCSGTLINTLNTYAAFDKHLSAYESFATVLIRNLLLLFRINGNEFNEFKNIYSTIIHSIIFPLLKIKEEQMILFQQEPEQFNRLAEDCCDHQKFGVLKSEVSMLLEIICDQHDQTAQYVIQHCIISLKVRLALDQNLQAQANNFLPVETALFVLCIQSYKLSKYQNELYEIKQILKYEKLKGRLSNLQLARLFTFFAYNYSEIYKNVYQGQIWIAQALKSDIHPTVQLSALDFITNVAQQYFNFQFYLNFGKQSIAKNINYLTTYLKIISIHMTKFEQGEMIMLVDILFGLIERQEDLYKKRKRKSTMDIVASLHLLKKIIDKGDYCNNKPLLKQKIWSVLNLMPKLQKISLDDQVVSIVVSFLKKAEFITEEILITLNPFIQIYQTSRQQSSAYLTYFNTVIMKTNFTAALHIGQKLIDTFITVYQQVSLNSRMIDFKIALGTILLILQNIIAIYGNDLGNIFIDRLNNLSLSIIPQSDNPQDKIDYILVARALNLLFLCHMHRRNENALRKLLTFQDSPLFQGYDLKVLCLCFSKEIFRETDIIAVTQMINLMVKAIATSKQESITIKSKKNQNSIKPSSTKIRIKRIQDYQKILKFIDTPFTQTSPPQLQLKNIIETMKKNNPLIYQGIIKSLNQTVVTKLKDLMSEVTVEGQKRKVIHVGSIKDNSKNLNAQIIIKGIKKRNHQKQSEDQSKQEYIQTKKRNLQKKKLKNEIQKQVTPDSIKQQVR